MRIKKTKKQKAKNCVGKRKLKFEDYKDFLEATQLENKINQRVDKKLNTNSLRENYKKSINQY